MSDEQSACHASLRVFGPDLDPAEVNAYVGVEATQGHRAGDVRPGGAAPYREGLWALSTKDAFESSDLSEHLRHLLDQVGEAREKLVQVLDRAGHRGDVFCYIARDQGHGGPSLPADVLSGFGDLGLSIGLDIYGPFAAPHRGRSAEEIRDRIEARLNDALRRPGMYGGQLALINMLSDLAWMDRREDALIRWGSRLVERSMWTSTGVVGAFERLAPDLHFENAAASVFADIAWSLGWLNADRVLDAADYWRMSNGSEQLVADTDLVVDRIVRLYGDPSVSIGGSSGKVLGFVGPESNHPIVWFHVSKANETTVCRRVGAMSLADDVLFTPSGSALRHPEPYPTEVLRGVPQPFRPDWF